MKAILILCAVLAVVFAAAYIGLRLAKATRLWPVAILILSAPLEVYRTSSGAGLNVSVFRLALGVATAVCLIDLARRRMALPRSIAVPFLLYIALLIWQVASLLFVTSNHSLGYRFLGQYACGILAAFLVTCYVRRNDLRVMVGIFAAAAVLPLAAGIFRVIAIDQGRGGDLPGLTELPLNLTIEGARQTGSVLLNGTLRLNATFADPNQFGFYIATALLVLAGAVCAALILERPVPWIRGISYLMLMVASALAVIGTYSRSTWLLATVGVLLVAVLLGRTFWTRQRAIGAILLTVAALAVATPLAASRLSSGEAANVKSTQVHEHTMRIALKLIGRHPVDGVGIGGYGRYAGQPPIISSSVSTFLTVGAELGVIGACLLIGAILTTAIAATRSVMRAAGPDRALLAGLVAAYLGLALANIIGEVWMNDFQWVLFGLVLAVTTQPRLSLEASRLFKRRVSAASPSADVDRPAVTA